jgi:hypothetical protein
LQFCVIATALQPSRARLADNRSLTGFYAIRPSTARLSGGNRSCFGLSFGCCRLSPIRGAVFGWEGLVRVQPGPELRAMPEHQVRGYFFPLRFGSAVRRPPLRRSALRVVRTLDSVLGCGTRRSLLRRSLPERRSLPFGSPGLPIRLSLNSGRSVLQATPRLFAQGQNALAPKADSDWRKCLQSVTEIATHRPPLVYRSL